MASPSIPYPLGGSEAEKRRLLLQAKEYEGHSAWLLDQIGIQRGWRAVDIGCGPMGILDLLAERVGSSGTVVGVEREARFVEMAVEELREHNLTKVEVVQADAMDTGLLKGSFDFVHERLVLLNVGDRPGFIRELISLARPGGVVALEDIDNVSWTCFPSHPSWDTLLNLFHKLFHRNGGNGFMGRELPLLLRTAGIKEPKFAIHAQFAEVGTYRRTHLLSLIESLTEKIIANSLMSSQELYGHRAALQEHLSNPDVSVIDKLLVQCWGVKA